MPTSPAEAAFRPTILLVEAARSGPEALRSRPEFANCKLLKAASERQALRLFVELDIDCVVVKESSPGLDATQLAGLMRCMRPEIPVVIVGERQEPS